MKAYSLHFLVMHRSLQSLTLLSCNNTKRILSCRLIFHVDKTAIKLTYLLAGFRLHRYHTLIQVSMNRAIYF